MPLPVWIVLANGSRARLLQRNSHAEPLIELRDWVHPATRLHTQDLGGAHRQSGIRGRSGLARHGSDQAHERSAFAQEICHWLAQAVHAQQVGSIALLASTPFLGELMAHGQGTLDKQLCAAHAVDLTALPLAQLEERLRQDYRL